MDPNPNHVQGKVIVITGAGGGFGRLTAQLAAALGARVVATDVNTETVDETAAGIVEQGGDAIAVTADVSFQADMHRVARAAVERYEAIDVLVNNAGIMPLAFFADHAQAAEAW